MKPLHVSIAEEILNDETITLEEVKRLVRLLLRVQPVQEEIASVVALPAKKKKSSGEVKASDSRATFEAFNNVTDLGYDEEELYDIISSNNKPIPRDRAVGVAMIHRRLSQDSRRYRKLDNGKWTVRKARVVSIVAK